MAARGSEDYDDVDGDLSGLTCLRFQNPTPGPAKNKPSFDRLNSTGESRDNSLESKTGGCREKGAIKPHVLQSKQDWWHSLNLLEKDKIVDHLEEALQTYKSELSCKVCLEKEVSRVFQPCGHLTCCADCAKMLKECPICRVTIKSLVVVVLPKPKTKITVDMETIAKQYRLADVLK